DKIKIKDAKVRFSIEDARTLLVENIRFKWCNGLVSTESIRIPQDNNAYSLNLYCDRLELAQLLKQTGAFHAEGTGTLNGRIPVIYSDGNISFDNGFLFSTPGSGGKIIIANSDMITAGIPMDNPQFAQLDLAQEALKEFEYKWAKLAFHTFEDTLYVNMELDGKPSNVLPFEYRKELGGFIRVDASSPGSHFQGIKLDVNLKLPFNEVMKFGNKIKSVFN
ncbi:MAG: YdbH domain-containing protein, partial [Desulfobacula sp.]|nr:YdbH domain-containing protein [Desulfobacula sp.]